jgi:hypothetical protein
MDNYTYYIQYIYIHIHQYTNYISMMFPLKSPAVATFDYQSSQVQVIADTAASAPQVSTVSS